MADKVILVDTSILIDYYRKTDKGNTIWMGLVKQGYDFVISAITKYELFSGATESQLTFWNDVLQIISVIPFDSSCVDTAVTINQQLKRKRKQIAIADLFIAATAVTIGLPIATLNKKHFERVDELIIVE
ncbi:MAG: type II toxin-antitoxin system VapC family toxin [Flavobacterium sp.]|nr:type II toxin-antitoxin system VapC family toxin [Flavobacterium sp.]